MELPFYLNYKEFESHYYDHLEQWFEKHHNTTETDFLKSLTEIYSPYLYYNFAHDRIQADASIQIKDCFFPYHEKIGLSFCTSCENEKGTSIKKHGMNTVFEWKTITMMEYAQHVLDKINRYFLKNAISPTTENILDYINNHEIITSKEGAGYCVNYKQHQQTIPFLKAYLPQKGQTVNMGIYQNFIFSIAQIADFIDNKLKSVKAFEYTMYSKLKSEAQFKVHMNHQFLTICN